MPDPRSCCLRPAAIGAGHGVQLFIGQGMAARRRSGDQFGDAGGGNAAIRTKPRRNGRIRRSDIRSEVANLWPYVFQTFHNLGFMHSALTRVNTFCIKHCVRH